MDVFAHFSPIQFDMYIGLEITSESRCVMVAMQAMQYERWGKDEVGESDPQNRYQNVTQKNYFIALDRIIARFRETTFAEQVEKIMIQHLHGLHTPIQHPDTPNGPHSDISPFWDVEMRIAKDVILGAHPTPINMRDTGVISNVKTLFGDADFWKYLRTNHIESFNRFVDYLHSFDKSIMVNTIYAQAEIDVVALIRDFFRDTYSVISSVREDFVSTSEIAIQIIKRDVF